jgi:hypothetical protein
MRTLKKVSFHAKHQSKSIILSTGFRLKLGKHKCKQIFKIMKICPFAKENKELNWTFSTQGLCRVIFLTFGKMGSKQRMV